MSFGDLAPLSLCCSEREAGRPLPPGNQPRVPLRPCRSPGGHKSCQEYHAWTRPLGDNHGMGQGKASSPFCLSTGDIKLAVPPTAREQRPLASRERPLLCHCGDPSSSRSAEQGSRTPGSPWRVSPSLLQVTRRAPLTWLWVGACGIWLRVGHTS